MPPTHALTESQKEWCSLLEQKTTGKVKCNLLPRAVAAPPGAGRITIDFDYTGKDQKTVIDIGVRDPDGQRGWSGGNKSHIEIGEKLGPFDVTLMQIGAYGDAWPDDEPGDRPGDEPDAAPGVSSPSSSSS